MFDGHAVTDERYELLLSAAHALHVNGQESEETLHTIAAFGKHNSPGNRLLLEWDTIILPTNEPHTGSVIVTSGSVPSSVSMNRVEAINQALSSSEQASWSPQELTAALNRAKQLPPASLWLFVLACAAGASALALIFGAVHPQAVAMIAGSAAVGGLLRRLVGRLGGGVIVQAFAASILAGLIGAVAVKLQISSELRLVAVCPCMILVPGPHLLNGSLDLTYLRIPLGLCRLLFALLILTAICIGVLLGLYLGGTGLPVAGPSREIALWLDVLAAGTAAASYSVYFSTPLTMIIWPVFTGMIAHAARWWVMTHYDFGAPSAAGLACLIVAALLIPVAARRKLPFAAIGFASIVSLMPGVLIFRMSSGLVAMYQHGFAVTPELLAQTCANAVTAVATILCMALGLILPKRLYESLTRQGESQKERHA